jgi:uncharacterized protein
MKKVIIIILISFILLYMLQRIKWPPVAVFSFEPKTVSLGDKQFNLEIANTRSEREHGLSGRKSLCQDCAMLFVFDKRDVYSFWMKGMRFDLDMLWIDGTKIVQIDKYISYLADKKEVRRSKIAIDRLLEINAGESDRLGLKEGDEAIFK